MKNYTSSPAHQMHIDSAKTVKDFFSIKDFNFQFDILLLIKQVKATRTAQKKYFANRISEHKPTLLIDAKTEELKLEKLCNELWQKHDLKTIKR